MSHLDDGQIAELIDGGLSDAAARQVVAHVATCAACEARVAEARRIADRARGILRSVAPADGPPPFRDITRRAGRPGRRRLPLRALALAATVVLAVGVGWYGRGFSLDESPPVGSGLEESQPITAALQTGRTADTMVAAPAAETPAAAPASAPAPAVVRQQNQPLEPTRVPARPGAVPADLAGASAGAADAAALPFRAAEAQRVESRAPAAAAAILRDSVVGWRTVSLDEAEQLLGGTVQSVAGLSTLGYSVRAVRGGVEVRTEQRLDGGGGGVLELLQRRVAARERGEAAPVTADRSLARAAGERRDDDRAARSLDIERDGFVITGRATISLDSLRALLLRLH